MENGSSIRRCRRDGDLNRDRISGLPCPLRQHILSFLSTEEAMTTSVLSSIWRYDWLKTPSIIIIYDSKKHDKCIFLQKHLLPLRQLHGFSITRKLHLDFSTLFRYPTFDFVDKFVSFCLTDDGNILDELTCHGIQPTTYPLKRNVIGRTYVMSNLFNSILASSKSLTKLHLFKCNLHYLTSDKIDEFELCFPLLRELFLSDLSMFDTLLCKLLAHCPQIETLRLKHCSSLQVIRISGHPNLKDVEVLLSISLHIRITQVEIDAPNLNRLWVHGFDDRVQVKILISPSCRRNLVELDLKFCTIEDDELNKLLNDFSHLKNLRLENCPQLRNIRIMSKCLVCLTIKMCQNLDQLELHSSPSLSNFEYHVTNKEVIVSVWSTFPIAPTCAHIYFPDVTSDPYDDFNSTKILSLLSKFNNSVTLHMNEKEITICPPLQGIEQLRLLLLDLVCNEFVSA